MKTTSQMSRTAIFAFFAVVVAPGRIGAQGPTTIPRTYNFPQSFNISLPTTSPCCTFNWGITSLAVDPSLIGNATVTSVSVSGTATVTGQSIRSFDWGVLADSSSFGFAAAGQVYVNSTNDPVFP